MLQKRSTPKTLPDSLLGLYLKFSFYPYWVCIIPKMKNCSQQGSSFIVTPQQSPVVLTLPPMLTSLLLLLATCGEHDGNP